MFDRPDGGEQAILVQLALGKPVDVEARQEFHLLARAAGARLAGYLTGSRDRPDARLFIGSGKAEELKELLGATDAELVIFDHSLSPAQERNLERLLSCRVVDRTGLILDIFARRARSFEGKLEVELAQLRHLSTRLVRGWTHLERQKGGIGLRGPGETQLETDRRLLGQRIAHLNKRLTRIASQRSQGRRARERAEIPTVALVGYTNAGKSTLFNRLTAAGVLAADQLFATLDPTLRRLAPPGAPPLVLADTVGFINQLPHELVAAFRSTLQEVRSADLLLHVIDASATDRDRRIGDVATVLADIGAADIPRIEIFNKTDLLDEPIARAATDADGCVPRIWLSAATGAGIDPLIEALATHFRGTRQARQLRLTPLDGALRAWLHAHAQVQSDQPTADGGWELRVLIAPGLLERHLATGPSVARPPGGEPPIPVPAR